MVRPQGSKNKPKIAYRCEDCGEVGTSPKKCLECGSTHLLELNKNGIPVTDMQNAVGAQPDMPILLGSAPDIMDPAAELRKVADEEKIQTISDLTLDKIKARAAKEKMERIRAEEELDLTEKGFRPPRKEEQEPESMMMPQRQIGMDPTMLLDGIGRWSEEARKDLFDRLSTDHDFALNWSRAFNTMQQQQMPANAQQMMNPYFMNPMMGQPAQQAEPPESAASMMTAMLAGLAQLQELSGGKGDDNAMLERLIDKMDRMEERHAEQSAAMQQKIVEIQSTQGQSQLTREDVQRLTQDAVSNATEGGIGLLAGLKSIDGVVEGLSKLGIVKRTDDNGGKETFEEHKWNKEFEFKKEDRAIARDKEEREADIAIAKQDTTKSMFSMMMNLATEPGDEDDDEVKEEEAKPIINRAVVS